MTFQEKLDIIVQKNNSLVCVGLDSDYVKIPEYLKNKKNAVFEFNKVIIDVTHKFVCTYKLNSAFYEAYGVEGIKQLKMTFDYINKNYPQITTILDAKRADIGNTNNGYVQFAFEYLGADAITLHPYLGGEALQPFLQKKDKGIFILCRTSNPGAGELQDLVVNDQVLYKFIAQKITHEWNYQGNCMIVVGATYPQELAEVRNITGDMTFLVPGIGAQGGDIEKTVKTGLDSKKAGLIISSSRGIIFASKGTDFADKARYESIKLRREINKYRGM